MPRYFFHVDDGVFIPDLNGTDLPDLNAARAEAVKAAGGMLKDEYEGAFDKSSSWQMNVTDDADQLLFTLRFGVDVPNGAVIYKPQA